MCVHLLFLLGFVIIAGVCVPNEGTGWFVICFISFIFAMKQGPGVQVGWKPTKGKVLRFLSLAYK